MHTVLIKFVIIGPRKLKTFYLKNAENNPIMMGANKLGFSEAERYLGDQISQEGASTSRIECLSKEKNTK